MEDQSGRGAPRVGELFQRAVQAQLAEQQAQRESIAEFSRRLEVSERLMTDGLGAIAKVLGASEHAIERLGDRLGRVEEVISATAAPGPELSAAATQRLDACEAALIERIDALDVTSRMEVMAERLAALELAVTERLETVWKTVSVGVETLAQSVETTGERYTQALDEARLSREALRNRLTELEGSVKKFEEQAAAHMLQLQEASSTTAAHLVELRGATATTEVQLQELREASAATEAQLVELRDASVAAEAGILERIILESQTVATHFETVRPAVEAVVTAAPGLETTLSELRDLAERVGHDDSGETGPYSAAGLLAPLDEEEHPIFQPPEETKIPDRRFWGRDR